MEPLALYMDFRDALEDIESEREFRSFEEVPYVEVTKQKDYEVVLDLLDRTPRMGTGRARASTTSATTRLRSRAPSRTTSWKR